MSQSDPVIAIALEYEAATLAAVEAIRDGSDTMAIKLSIARFRYADKAWDELPNDDFNRVGFFLTDRARITEADWRLIGATAEAFLEGRQVARRLH